MQLKKIQSAITQYKSFIQQRKEDNSMLFAWESQAIFQDNWDIDAPNFAEMYGKSLENSYSRRLWTGDNFEPKKRMLDFINLNTEFVRNMFKALFEENKPIENRISKFQFGCDIMLDDFKSANPTSIENNHFHQDSHIISLYLAFRFPEKYALFFYPSFEKCMQYIGSTKVPTVFEKERFFKITNTLNTFLEKDEELMEIHQASIAKHSKYYQDKSMLLVTDFYRYIGSL